MKDYSKLSQVSLEVQRDYQVDSGRVERAARIVQNHEVRQLSPTRYAVQSQSKKAEYLVDLDTVQCGCPDAQRDHVCKHFIACAIYRALPEKPLTLDELIAQATAPSKVAFVSDWGRQEFPHGEFGNPNYNTH